MVDLGYASLRMALDGSHVWVGIEGRQLVKIPKDLVTEVLPDTGGLYTNEEVTFANGDTTLAGTLLIPSGTGPFSGVVMVTTGGAHGRDSVDHGFRVFAVIADHLARNGVAVLRFDDREIGGSGGNFDNHIAREETGDVMAAVDAIKGDSRIDGDKIGLFGHGMGGSVSVATALEDDDVAFVVFANGDAMPLAEVLRGAVRPWLSADGESEAYIQDILSKQEEYFHAILTGEGLEELAQSIERGPVEQIVAWNLEPEIYVKPYFKSVVSYDPVPDLEKLTKPILGVFGGKDLEGPVELNIASFRSALQRAGNTDIEVVMIDGANHIFHLAESGSPTEYPKLKPEFAPGFVETVTDWILERFGVAP